MTKQSPTIQVLYCANSMTEAECQDLQARLNGTRLKMLRLPCSGKATIPYLLKAFEKDVDGIVLCTCPESRCRHLEGNLRASRRAEAVQELLDEIGFGKDLVVVITKEQGGSEELIDAIQRVRAELDKAPSAGVRPGRAVLAGVRAGGRRENAA